MRTAERRRIDREKKRECLRRDAAVLLQRAFRKHLERKLQDRAAAQIQQCYRICRSRRLRTLLLHLNAVKIQSFWRATAAKHLLNHLRRQHVSFLLKRASEAAELSASAILIQRKWRRHHSSLLREMSQIAARQAIRNAERWTMALRIQNAFRQYQIYRMLSLTCEQLTEKLEASATTISAAFRGWIVRLHGKQCQPSSLFSHLEKCLTFS